MNSSTLVALACQTLQHVDFMSEDHKCQRQSPPFSPNWIPIYRKILDARSRARRSPFYLNRKERDARYRATETEAAPVDRENPN